MPAVFVQNADLVAEGAGIVLKVCAVVILFSELFGMYYAAMAAKTGDMEYKDKSNAFAVPAVVCIFLMVASYAAIMLASVYM